MKFIILFAFVACVYAQQYPIVPTDSNCGKGTPLSKFTDFESKITGGSIVQKGTFGWTVAIMKNGNLLCGGAIVNSLWVITSAVCIYGSDTASLSVDIGVQDRNSWDSWSTTRRVFKYVIHSNFVASTFRNDIALIKLASPINIDTFNYRIIPICIPSGLENYEGRNAYITGYGSSYSGGPSSRYLMQVQTRILADAYCRSKFSTYYSIDSSTQLCAGDNFQNQDFCQYDNGGPLAVKSNLDGRWHLVGIASFGRNPCGNGGVYTRVSTFANFITYTINNN